MLLCSREDDPRYFNPLAPESDWFLISPYGSHLESNVKVMRIKEMITNIRSSLWVKNKFSLSVPWEMYRILYREDEEEK